MATSLWKPIAGLREELHLLDTCCVLIPEEAYHSLSLVLTSAAISHPGATLGQLQGWAQCVTQVSRA